MKTEVEIREYLEELENDPRSKYEWAGQKMLGILDIEIRILKWVLEIKEEK